MKAILSTTLVFASLMLSISAQARTLYWTGYGIQPGICYSAPITQIEDYGFVSTGYDYYGYPIYQYARRVYINVP